MTSLEIVSHKYGYFDSCVEKLNLPSENIIQNEFAKEINFLKILPNVFTLYKMINLWVPISRILQS